jgi:carbon-monoxide dehydrogenase medium subunit
MTQSAYFVPKSIEEAISLLSRYGEKAEVLSGGTDLLVQLKKGVSSPQFIISLDGLRDLDYIDYQQKEGLKIGALTSIGAIADSSLIKEKFKVLSQAAGTLGTPVIRNRATIGGNLCNAAPSADTAPALMVLGAKLKIQGGAASKTIPIHDFFFGPGRTILNRNELLSEIQVFNQPPHSRAVYLKQTRSKSADLAIVGVAVLIVMEKDIIKDAKIALGAVAPTPIRAKKAEDILKGNRLKDELIEECGKAAALESRPIDDVRGSAAYRVKIVSVLVKRAIKQIIDSGV